MSYLALYRKYRPNNFDDLVGQSEIANIIKNEILHDKISHAYLFSGPRGTGKTSTAKIIARKTAENELRRRSYTKGFEPEPVVQEVAIPPITSIPKERDIRFGKTPQHEPMMEPQPVAEPQPEIQHLAVQPSQAPTPQPKAEEMMVFNRTVRGGEEIISEGSILICGNVHVGAHIVAGGNIDIRGTCSGIVHAGSRGDSTAYIIADKMEPMQIRIANMVARCPDNVEETSGAEKAYVKDGKIIVEAVTR